MGYKVSNVAVKKFHLIFNYWLILFIDVLEA